MKTPSVKALVSTFNIAPASAAKIKRIGRAVAAPGQDDADALEEIIDTECPATAAYVRRLHSSPYNSHTWRVTVALHAMDVIMGTHGVEALGGDDGRSPAYEYLNTGDTYDATLVYHRRSDTLRIGSWGDIAERMSA